MKGKVKKSLLLAAVVLPFLLISTLVGGPASVAEQQKRFTEWGWPLPYEKVSDASVKWLKQKGWWPLRIAYQIDAAPFLLVREGHLKARGLEAEAVPFAAGPPMLEAFVAGKIQAVFAGNFPTTTIIDKGFNVFSPCHYLIGATHYTFVPLDSPITKITDLKLEKLGRPAIIGLPVGSSAEFYFRRSCEVSGIEIGKDVILKDMSGPDIILMPKGIDAFAIWEPWAFHIIRVLKIAKPIDSDWRYEMYYGYMTLPQDLLEVPDVVQAIVDAYVESNLKTRWDMVAAAKLVKAEHAFEKNYPWATIMHGISVITYLKPTWPYMCPDFEAKELAGVAKFLYDTHRTKTLVTAARYKEFMQTKWLTNTFQKLGWAIPEVPANIPKGWAGEPGKPPYPFYPHWPFDEELGKPADVRPFPEPGDLVAPWYFKGKWYKP